ncbi:hypothetical protein L3Q82_022530 [Scortum barcoo]|uniref:Uncharacterized protein n=1 Tax=Scortum barcoo TaxID=214431 RepID=A0ACB8X1K1_9TELE|nr:hypothetical protein L3Q82_022530 [Scortum barcoo]
MVVSSANFTMVFVEWMAEQSLVKKVKRAGLSTAALWCACAQDQCRGCVVPDSHHLRPVDVTPPESNPRENLIVAQLKDGSTVNLCANSEDESIAWKLTLLETRRNPVFTYDPYDDSYQAIPLNSYQTVYITPGAGPGTHQVVVQRDPFDGVMESLALGVLAGMAAGTAMRSFLWMPLFFC